MSAGFDPDDDHHTETMFPEGLKSDLATDLRELTLSSSKCFSMKQLR